MAGSGGMNAREHGITEQSVLAILAEALSSFPEPSLPGWAVDVPPMLKPYSAKPA